MTATLRTALATVLLVTPAVASADFYQYETEGGVISFTDDAGRIPARYADRAESTTCWQGAFRTVLGWKEPICTSFPRVRRRLTSPGGGPCINSSKP